MRHQRQTTHSEGCWKFISHHFCAVRRVERLQEEIERLRETNSRLNRRCQQAEAMETEYRHAAGTLRSAARQTDAARQSTTHWLGRLRKTVRDQERLQLATKVLGRFGWACRVLDTLGAEDLNDPVIVEHVAAYEAIVLLAREIASSE